MKQTAVEWLREQYDNCPRYEENLTDGDFSKALEMEKDQAEWQAEKIGLMEIELNNTKTLLESCEKALEDRDKKAERMYSEEDMAEAFIACWKVNVPNGIECKVSFNEWFEQFKKK
jgi:choline kinase